MAGILLGNFQSVLTGSDQNLWGSDKTSAGEGGAEAPKNKQRVDVVIPP